VTCALTRSHAIRGPGQLLIGGSNDGEIAGILNIAVVERLYSGRSQAFEQMHVAKGWASFSLRGIEKTQCEGDSQNMIAALVVPAGRDIARTPDWQKTPMVRSKTEPSRLAPTIVSAFITLTVLT